jgi:general secretion pathway protein M
MKRLKLPTFAIPALPSLAGLHRRERMAIYAAGVALIIFLIVQFIIFPLVDQRRALQAQIKSKQIALQEINALRAEYETLTRINRTADENLKKRAKNFTLFSFLDNLAGTSKIKQNIVYMKPSTSNLKNSPYTLSIVEIKMQSITMEQMVTFLYGVEMSDQQIWIKRMSLTRDEKKEGLLDSIIQVETYQI